MPGVLFFLLEGLISQISIVKPMSPINPVSTKNKQMGGAIMNIFTAIKFIYYTQIVEVNLNFNG